MDETGWRTNAGRRHLWAFVAAGFVLFTIAKTRGSELLIQSPGAVFEGILCKRPLPWLFELSPRLGQIATRPLL